MSDESPSHISTEVPLPIASNPPLPPLAEVRQWPEWRALQQMGNHPDLVPTVLGWLTTKHRRRNAVAAHLLSGAYENGSEMLFRELVIARGKPSYQLRLLEVIKRVNGPIGFRSHVDLRAALSMTRNSQVRDRILEILQRFFAESGTRHSPSHADLLTK